MLLYIMLLCVLAVAFSGYTAFQVFGLREDIDALSAAMARIDARLEEDAEDGVMRRVTIARARDVPDALEAEMERRASKTPVA